MSGGEDRFCSTSHFFASLTYGFKGFFLVQLFSLLLRLLVSVDFVTGLIGLGFFKIGLFTQGF